MINEVYDSYLNKNNSGNILYEYDKELKLLLFKYLIIVENKIKMLFTNNFISRYGDDISLLYNTNNFDKNMFIEETIKLFDKQLNQYLDSNNVVNYYLKNYEKVPIKVYINCISFGLIRDFIKYSKQNDKDHIYKLISNIQPKKMDTILDLLVIARNLCCHNDILFSYENNKLEIPDLDFYKKNYKKNNFLAIVLSLKVYLNDDDYLTLIEGIYNLMIRYSKKLNISINVICNLTNLPNNKKELI